MVAGVQLMCGRLHAQAGDFAAGLAQFRAAAAVATGPVRAEALQLCGHAALDAERPDEAIEPLTEAIGGWLACDEPHLVAHTRAVLADALARTGRYEEAAGVAEDALAGLDGPDDMPARVDTLLLMGTVYRELRATDAAVEALDEVARYCAGNDNAAGVGEANARIAEILDGVDRDAEAAQRWADGAAAFRTARLAASGAGEAGETGAVADGPETGATDGSGAGDGDGAGSDPAERDERVARLAVDELRAARNAALSWQWAEQPERALAALPAADEAARVAGTDRPRACWEVAVLGYDAGRILANAERPDEAVARTGSAVALFAGLRASGDLDPAPTAVEIAVRTLHARLLTGLGRRADARSTLTALLDELPPAAEEHRADITALLADTER
jgi:tetratricopeptide (TPR) repeat protein